MSRILSEDTTALFEFFQNYTLNQQFQNKHFVLHLKTMHKKLYGYLLVINELSFRNADLHLFSQNELNYLCESVSDCMQSFFCWVNGAYKGSRLLLRSSIETFVKAIVGQTDPTVFTEKSVYAIFDKAKLDKQLSLLQLGKAYADILHEEYGNLCAYTHSANVSTMDKINCLNTLPKYEDHESQEIVQQTIRLLDAILGFWLNGFPQLIFAMHQNNQRIYFEILPSTIKEDIFSHKVGNS